MECQSAIHWLSVECRSAIQLVLLPGERDISGAQALFFGGRLGGEVDDDVGINVLGCRVDILGTSRMVQAPASAFIHVIVQSALTGTQPHQANLLLCGQGRSSSRRVLGIEYVLMMLLFKL